MDNIEVTVICLTYNHGKYIRQCLDGFIMQKTNFNFEIIIHDDASLDNTQEIITEYVNKYPDLIKPILQRKNQYQNHVNIYPTFIQSKVRGKYIALCEGDDFWTDSNKLQKQYDTLENNKDCVFCTNKVLCCDKNGNLLEKTYPQADYQINKSMIFTPKETISLLYTKHMYPFQTSSYFMKKEVYDKIPDIFGSMLDRNMLLTGCLYGNFYYINEPMSTYRRFTETSWSANTKDMNKAKRNQQDIYLLNYDYTFDKVTNNKYHQLILYRVSKFLYNISKTNSNDSKQILTNFNVKFIDLFKHCGLNQTVTIYLSIYFSSLMNFIRKDIKKTL